MREIEVAYLLGARFFRLSAMVWGDWDRPKLVCVHGLTRNARDFDWLAEALADRLCVICPDLPGRGRSEWLPEASLYQPASYVVALAHVLARIGEQVAWVGTSLGGICGMLLAAAPGTPITRLVLNDVGSFIPEAAIARIAAYIGQPESFADLAALERHFRQVYAPFGALSDAQWSHLARHSARALPDGRVGLHSDPRIAEQVRAAPAAAVHLEPVWDAVHVPTLVLRGAESDLLLAETAEAMATKARLHVVPGAGHAPALMDQPTIAVVREFLATG